MQTSTDPRLQRVIDKQAAGDRLDAADGLAMLETHDVVGLGRLANADKERRTGPFVAFVLNRQVNPTNVCVLSCRFCDFATKVGDDNAYEMTLEKIRQRVSEPIREVHVVGGMHPDWRFERYVEVLEAIREANPTAQIKAYTAVEIDFFAHLEKISVDEVFERLEAAGMQAMPGGGAEVFSERVREIMYKEKMGHERWLEIHEIAHRRGLRTNATLLYGHVETYEERVNHLLMLREMQDRTGGFLSFIPLAFQPGYTNIVSRQASAIEDLRTIATSRLMLDNFPHIKAYWVMLGEETASMALQWGADDLDGTIGEELIAHAALASSPAGMTTHKLVKLIREAGRLPVQRDALYNVVGVYPAPGSDTHWAQRHGDGGVDPVPMRGLLAEAKALDVEGHGVKTWEMVTDAGREVRELAQKAATEIPAEAVWLTEELQQESAENVV
ncbi:MAG: aminofutalosine synthase MqnE [Acidobacteria bacterium]|nr:aminofutalosine synthase MqnE [Acidobacteriota bacterium]